MSIAEVIELPHRSAGDDVLARLRTARELLAGIPEDLVGVLPGELAEAAAEVARVVAAAGAAQAAVVLEASSRGVIARCHRDVGPPAPTAVDRAGLP